MDLAKIAEVLQTTGPYGVTALFVWLYMNERSYTQTLHGKIIEMVTKGTEASVTQSNALDKLKEVISNLSR